MKQGCDDLVEVIVHPNIAPVKQASAKGTNEMQGTWQQTGDLNITIEWILVISMKMIVAPADY